MELIDWSKPLTFLVDDTVIDVEFIGKVNWDCPYPFVVAVRRYSGTCVYSLDKYGRCSLEKQPYVSNDSVSYVCIFEDLFGSLKMEGHYSTAQYAKAFADKVGGYQGIAKVIKSPDGSIKSIELVK